MNPPRNLSERRFRGYWEQTKGTNERKRFAARRLGIPSTPLLRNATKYLDTHPDIRNNTDVTK